MKKKWKPRKGGTVNIICEIKNELIDKQKKDTKTRKNYYVYQLINPTDNKVVYVGKGYGNRMYDHEKDVLRNKYPNNNRYLFYKIKKILHVCGKINYKKVIENLNERDALLKEKMEIKRIGRTNLCNLTDGGEGTSGYVYSNELKHKKSLLVRGKNNPFYGKKHTQQTLTKISNSLKGNVPYIKGKTHTNKIKKLLSKISKGKKFSKLHKQRISESLKKPINQFNKNLIHIQRWNSISDASSTLNIDKSSIVKCLKGKIPLIGGYKWRYV